VADEDDRIVAVAGEHETQCVGNAGGEILQRFAIGRRIDWRLS
jgi:hypothetical protein